MLGTKASIMYEYTIMLLLIISIGNIIVNNTYFLTFWWICFYWNSYTGTRDWNGSGAMLSHCPIWLEPLVVPTHQQLSRSNPPFLSITLYSGSLLLPTTVLDTNIRKMTKVRFVSWYSSNVPYVLPTDYFLSPTTCPFLDTEILLIGALWVPNQLTCCGN
jgi:hypothetical protein